MGGSDGWSKRSGRMAGVADDQRAVAGATIIQCAIRRHEADEAGDEPAIFKIAGHAGVDARKNQQRVGVDFCQCPHQRAALRDDQRRGQAVAGGVAEENAQAAVAGGPEVEHIAAGGGGGLRPAGDFDAGDFGRMLGDHRLLHPAGEVHFLFQRRDANGFDHIAVPLNGDAGLIGEKFHHGAVVGGKTSAALVDDLKHAQRFAVGAGDGAGDNIARAKAHALIVGAIESLIGVGVGNVNEAVVPKRCAHDAGFFRDADFRIIQRDLGPEFAGLGVVKKDAGSFAIQHVAGGFGDLQKKSVQIARPGQGRETDRTNRTCSGEMTSESAMMLKLASVPSCGASGQANLYKS